jgi:hypothetical protein
MISTRRSVRTLRTLRAAARAGVEGPHRAPVRRRAALAAAATALLLGARPPAALPAPGGAEEPLRAVVAQLADGDLPPQSALAAARQLMARVPAAAAERTLTLDPQQRRRLLAGFGRAAAAAGAAGTVAGAAGRTSGPLGSGGTAREGAASGSSGIGTPAPAAPISQLADWLAAWARQRAREMAARGRWTAAEVADLAAQQLVDPQRFDDDPAFRAWVLELLPRELDPGTLPGLRDELLLAVEARPGIDFGAAEAVETAWGAAPRRSAERLAVFGGEPLRFDDDAEEPIAASVLSLPSSFFDPPQAVAFLSALRAAAPRRDLVVLADLPMRRRLAACCGSPRLHLLETYGRPFTPWTRDPISLVRKAAGGVVVLARPNVQAGREEDSHLAEELVRRLPPDLDRAWGGVRWTVAPVPFHNGQVLLQHDAAWISVHTLEPRALALLGLERVPVESFATEAGIERYFAAVQRAAAELAELYGRPVRFVHPLPGAAAAGGAGAPGASGLAAAAGSSSGTLPPAASRELVERIGGGAGYDLDSVLTLLPAARRNGRPTALVASVAAGRALLARLTAGDWGALRRGYDLRPAAAELAGQLGAAQQAPAAARLDAFLDLVAGQLGGQGFRIERLPLVLVPVRLLTDAEGVGAREFLLTWNNVVLETTPAGQLRAEGFSSLLPAGDREARRLFTAAGCRLDLLPALVHSIVLNGGYRCASNHLRGTPGQRR